MTTTNSPKRPGAPAGAPGVKFFLTAASLTSIIGGWAGLTVSQTALAQAEYPSDTAMTDSAQVAPEFPPMPTLVSAPGTTAFATNTGAPVPTPRPASISSGGGGGGGGGQSGLPQVRVRQAHAPVTRTRSSRP